ncbi:MAG: hydantoinase B/oxoprolinase family protein [Gammaproteobacteria bacterium]|nr:hydantoinase B/oxoprolinase family protein [Gammaproteobacteria bacterium]
MNKIDPITLSVIEGALQAAQRAMTTTMEKTGRSSVYAIARDYSNAVFDWDARMIIQGEDIPTHLGSMVLAAKAVARYFDGQIQPGDIFLHNDPTYDGSHLPDVCMYKPVFFEDELVFWVVSKGHMVDVGGPVPGSYNPDAREIYAEGLRIPPIKLVDQGVMREDILNMILTNFRSRKMQAGDMNAQLGAIRVGEKRLLDILQRYGVQTVKVCVEELLDSAEQHMREKIRALPDGTYPSTVLAEDTGHGRGHQTLEAEIVVSGDSIKIALDSPPQVDFFTNSYRSNTLSGVYCGLLMWAQVQPPFNEGLYRPIEVDYGSAATMMNAQEPAPHVNCTGGPQETICDLIRTGLNKADAQYAMAGWNHTWAFNIAGVRPENGEAYLDLLISSLIGGAGAVNNVADGWHCIGAQAGLGGAQIGDTEVVEMLAPVIITRLELSRDSGVPGKWRGGCGLVTEVEPIDHEMTVIAWGEGAFQPPPSVDGARYHDDFYKAKLARGYHLRDEEILKEVDSNQILKVLPGERYRSQTSGGGGAGDPFTRDPLAVQDDVLNKKVSLEAARFEYGVILDAEHLSVDVQATDELRKSLQ